MRLRPQTQPPQYQTSAIIDRETLLSYQPFGISLLKLLISKPGLSTAVLHAEPCARDMGICHHTAAMNKAFTKENDSQDEDDAEISAAPLPAGVKNYITPAGYQALQAELRQLVDVERPQIVETVHWAAKNGDRSENGDYLYGKKRLREIDRRLRFLTKRLEIAEVVDASAHHGNDQVFFGATVTYETDTGEPHTITIVGVDEADSLLQRISWVSPVARALLKARTDDEVALQTPAGLQRLTVTDVRYPRP